MGSTHWKAARNTSTVKVTAVLSKDPRKQSGDLSEVRGNQGGPGERMEVADVTAYANLDDLLADPNIDAVDLCLPTHMHESVAVAALRAGKHVLVEKPMALDGSSADRMIAAADSAGRILMTAQVLRFWPEFIALREAVRDGRFGSVRLADFRRRCAPPDWSDWLVDSARSGGGIFDLLIHDVDMCLHLLGPPEAVSAVGYDEYITARFFYPDGAEALVSGGWLPAIEFAMEFTVTFERGLLDFSSDGRPLGVPVVTGRDGYTGELEYFAECCRTGAFPALCPPRESAAAVKLALLMLESRNRNGEKLACTNLV